MTTDERSETLARQAAAWVPPWERTPRAAAVPADAEPDDAELDDAELDDAEPDDAEPDGGDEGAGTDVVPDELPPVPGEAETPPTVDAPQPGEAPAPIDPEITEVDEPPAADPREDGVPIDAPVPLDGTDSGLIFDTAADDDPEDDIDLPISEDTDAGTDAGTDGRAGAGADADAHSGSGSGAAAGSADVSGAGSGAAGVGAVVPVQGRGRRDTQSLGVAAEQRTHELAPLDDDRGLRAALESILLVVDQPVAEMHLAQIVEQPVERVAAVLDALSAEFTTTGRGFDLRRAAGGWRLYTRPEYAGYVERFVLDGQSTRLTQAALETLAVVAYKQPVTRSRISAIRGVNCDGVMRTLVTRGLVEECGTESESGAYLYRTTMVFLEKLGLNSVDQLPSLAPFLPDDVEEEYDAQR